MVYYCARRTVVFRTEHTRRSVVERVDFISATGISPASVLRSVVRPKMMATDTYAAWAERSIASG